MAAVAAALGAAAAAADFFSCSLKQQIQRPPCADVLWRIIENQHKARCYSSVTDISCAGRYVIHLLLYFSLSRSLFLRWSLRLLRVEIGATGRLQTNLWKPFNLGSHTHKPTNEHLTIVQPLVSGITDHIDH